VSYSGQCPVQSIGVHEKFYFFHFIIYLSNTDIKPKKQGTHYTLSGFAGIKYYAQSTNSKPPEIYARLF
jgi:hypothetical protein